MPKLGVNLLWAVGGATLGYLVAQNRLEKEFHKELNLRIDNAKDYYRRQYEKKLQKADKASEETPNVPEQPEEIVEVSRGMTAHTDESEERLKPPGVVVSPAVLYDRANEAVTNYQGITLAPSIVSQEQQETDTPAEPLKIDRSAWPTVISEEEFFESKTGYTQYQYTYYHGDDILADGEEKILSSFIKQFNVGEDILELLKTGLPDDEFILYVRTPRADDGRGAEFEIAWSPGTYTDEVGPIGSKG
jgi:hypothetical protein